LKIILLYILCAASILDATIYVIGLGWFGSRLSSYTIATNSMVVGGLIVGAVSLFMSYRRALNRLVIVVLLLSLVAVVLSTSREDVELSLLSGALITIYLGRILAAVSRDRQRGTSG
jgi:hypothetical protein